MRVLLVEDNVRLASLTKRALKEEGYAVDIAENGQSSLDLVDIYEYDLVVLDLTLPDIDGIEVCKTIRNLHKMPIIMLTARESTFDRVAGLDSGADDYLVKPFTFDELLARIRAVLRRRATPDRVVIEAGQLRLDAALRTVYCNDKALGLSAKEYTLLQYLIRKQNQVVSKTELLEHVWDMNYEGLSNVVETYIRYLRQKIKNIGGDAEQIKTIKGQGYLLQA
ncbi:MAG TPA: response regulator transcription factor [Verrucomicrobiae bacterium]|nr:response regulator transcription factor [Verrucomicrobiae bacterium]